MHRIFAALPVPDSIAERLLPLKGDVFGARWRQRRHFHITLQFYGNVTTEIAEEIAEALEQISAPQLTLELQGVGWFGSKAPYSLYARIAPNETLNALAADCRKIARRLNLKIDQNPFKPHITLAYCHDTPLEEAMRWSEDYQILRSEPFVAESFHLYESFTAPNKPSRYEAQADYWLG